MEEPRRLGGRYELGSVLGRGGMAEVYLAHDTRLGRTVAVKTLRADLARDPSFQARFRREAQSAASLNHPAIVAVYDTGEDYVDGVSIPYIVMEYVDGSTLRELLHSGRKLLPERTLEMTVGILQALEYSHRAGIVHRDIKPANVMLTRTGQVKVMDFGIARAMGDSGMTMTQTAAVIGTAQYLSPEQAKGEQVDARSDLYSTGCLLYELLTVRPPFIGDSPVAVAYQHVREEPQKPSNFDPEITPEMDAIVLKALVKDPDYRYQSADEMRADIEACLDGQPVAATAAMGAAGYGGYDGYGNDQPTTALRAADQNGAQTSMLPPVNPDDGGYGYDDRPDRRRQKKSNTSTILLIVAGVLVLIGAILIGQSVFSNRNSDSDKFDVPNMVGSTVKEAERLADNAGVVLKVGSREPCEDQPKGKICSQTPTDDETMAKKETVTVVVSTGAPKVDVPNVVEKTEATARKELEAQGFTVNVTAVESEKTSGTVIKQTPDGNTKAEKNSEVTITVAKQATQKVPNVADRDYNAAVAQLNGLGFTNVSRTDVDSEKPANQVISQTPPPDSMQPLTAQIVLTVSKGPQQPEQTTVPDLQGKTLGEAKGLLTAAGLQLGQVQGPNDDNAKVVTFQPGANQPVDKNSAVNVVTMPGGGDGNIFGGPSGRHR
ncbi:Stk1 family PASTA domain-containing Ser/Thr kinase [Streptomyces sp. NBC_00053]|uniref:Stk1 family PASTA domain-containing Ser/Thr kinase n=1 Tax=unclassified Streptomyces TaxID=2593676 RepID=UPI0022547182|nr:MULTISPECIES: Stk1 family PASTA domain-containing Ser/Thr kinase [unclassified Streptomyces]WSG52015.1 Stk1 family PASTA domain-containing Ser/Thr kinase [Streptomyces sp. NBC_01732]WSX02629.1 Stk1 family PASTA domain-containing Ser/Thr kinase [Streptomyces sp. NBC_00987]MCX5101923.1 Stk1 family PASTA domain-containing Ser/Thr kinase [Streptomyces sp. NBC_00439]MCX5161441.1 Stk1 family PASTA domain-containing Ser/Thr kinase [Streptomyces sp. NBC_00305]MCX5219964.1 Stk1 family PASTA domain-c